MFRRGDTWSYMVDLPAGGHGSFLGEINDTDFGALLQERNTA